MLKFLTVDDLAPFATIDEAKAKAMIEDAEATAALVAPCINDQSFNNWSGIRAILRGAILRWNEAGTGAVQQQSAGPFGMTVDTRQERRGMFWPSEIEALQNLCGSLGASAYTVSMAGD